MDSTPSFLFKIRRVLVTLSLLAPLPASAQVAESFTDGDVTTAPPWTGTLDRWQIHEPSGAAELHSNGLPEADTLYLSTRSAVAFGTWRFTFRHEDVNLSNANGTRIYLLADQADLRGSIQGYFVQLGANNADYLDLYRQDGPSTASGRLRLGRSENPMLVGEANTVVVEVHRSPQGAWHVVANRDTVLTADDLTYTASAYMGIWLKHSATAGAAFYYDDIFVEGEAHVDQTPPVLLSVVPETPTTLRATFDEALDRTSACAESSYLVSGGIGPPIRVDCTADPVTAPVLHLGTPLAEHTVYAVTVSGLADIAGNRLVESTFSVFVGETATPGPGDLIVNEVFFDPPGPDLEFVELFNRTDQVFDLGTLRLADGRTTADGSLRPVPLTERVAIVPPRGYVVLVEDSSAFADAFPGVPFLAVAAWPTLNNGSDAAVLLHHETVLDSLAYSASWGAPGRSLERVDPNGPTDGSFNWAPSLAPEAASPGRQNTRYAPDRTPPAPRFVEQQTDTTLVLHLEEPLDASRLDRATAVLDTGRSPHARSFSDAPSPTLVLAFDAPIEATTLVLEGLSDRSGNVLAASTYPIHRAARPGDLIFNEVLYDPLADPFDHRPDQPEYVELFNPSPYSLSVRGLFWTGPPDEKGKADTLRLTEALLAVPPGGFVVCYAEPTASPDPSASPLAHAFPELDVADPGVVLIPLNRASLSLGNQGDLLRLHRVDQTLLEELAYAPGWHNANLYETTGTSLERLTASGAPNDPSQWTSSVAPAGGTPGRPNSITVSASPPSSTPGLHLDPEIFSPDGDGHDDVTAIRFTLPVDAATVRVRLFDAGGRPVRTLEETRFTGSSGTLVWDGQDDAGRSLPVGIYVVLLEAVDNEGGQVRVYKAPVVLARRLR